MPGPRSSQRTGRVPHSTQPGGNAGGPSQPPGGRGSEDHKKASETNSLIIKRISKGSAEEWSSKGIDFSSASAFNGSAKDLGLQARTEGREFTQDTTIHNPDRFKRAAKSVYESGTGVGASITLTPVSVILSTVRKEGKVAVLPKA